MADCPRIRNLARTMTRIGVSGNEPTNPDQWPQQPQGPAGKDDMGQTMLAVQAVQQARPDTTAADALAAVNLV